MKRAKGTFINLEKEYRGQKKAFLTISKPFKSPETTLQKASREWTKYFSSHKTNILDLTCVGTTQDLINSLANQQQLTTFTIVYGSRSYRDLSVLGSLPNLRKLVIEGFPSEASLEGLTHSTSLRILHVFSRKPLDFTPLAKMTMLEELEIGTGVDPAFRGRVKTPNLNFLQNLSQLKHLEFRNLIPEDKDMSPLQKLTNLQTGGYSFFRGQYPDTKELAKVNPVFAEVHGWAVRDKEKGDIDVTKQTRYSKWKWGR
jgi:hypothetical protein